MKKYFNIGEILTQKETGYVGYLAGIFLFETLTLHYYIVPIKKLMTESAIENNSPSYEGNIFDPNELSIFEHNYGKLFNLPDNILDVGDIVKDKNSEYKGIIISILLHQNGINYGMIDYPEKNISEFTYLDHTGVELVEKHYYDESILKEKSVH